MLAGFPRRGLGMGRGVGVPPHFLREALPLPWLLAGLVGVRRLHPDAGNTSVPMFNFLGVTHLLWMVVRACGRRDASSDNPPPILPLLAGAGDGQVPGLAHVGGLGSGPLGGSTPVPRTSPSCPLCLLFSV